MVLELKQGTDMVAHRGSTGERWCGGARALWRWSVGATVQDNGAASGEKDSADAMRWLDDVGAGEG